MSGFVSKPTLNTLAEVAQKHAIPLIEDLGSGCMIPLAQYGVYGQPVVADSIKAGVDIVTFSGDKLLGGPQAGIIIGRADLVAQMKSHPLARAMRIDKLSIAALEATLRLYSDPKTAVEKIPVLNILCAPHAELVKKAKRLKSILDKHNIGKTNITTENSKAGGGAMPEEELPSAAVSIEVEGLSPNEIQNRFRASAIPVIGRISKDIFLLDVRTINEEEFPLILEQYRRFSI
jgi:L-seryl-tRNA(Ser) seleniumtransferase